MPGAEAVSETTLMRKRTVPAGEGTAFALKPIPSAKIKPGANPSPGPHKLAQYLVFESEYEAENRQQIVLTQCSLLGNFLRRFSAWAVP